MRQEKTSMRQSVRCPFLGKLLMTLTIANIALTALFLNGCATRKAMEANTATTNVTTYADSLSQMNQDSLYELVEVRMEPKTVPMSSASLTIAMDSLHNLPSGACYSERSGQSSVKVLHVGATATEPEYIYVYATCDSLQLQCERYERLVKSLRKDYATQQTAKNIRLDSTKTEVKAVNEQTTNGVRRTLKWLSIPLFVIIGIAITIKLIKK